MNIKKIASCAAAAALALSMSAFSVSAADWAQSSYADDDPGTVEIISTDANGATFTQGTNGSCKLRLTLDKIIKNPDDVSKIYSGSWDMTYNGLSVFTGTEIGWLGGGCYAATCNSAGFGLSPNDYDENGAPIWEDEQTVEDTFKWLLPTQVPADASEAEFVFMDWSGQDLVGNNVTVSISNLHFYDKDGNEIEQLGYGEYGGAAPAAEEAAPAAEEAPAETEAPAAEEAPVENVAPASDNTSTAASTGNASAGVIASVMAVAAVAAVAAKKRN